MTPDVISPLDVLTMCERRFWWGKRFSGKSWDPWRAYLHAVLGIPSSDPVLNDLILKCTGLPTPPTRPAREVWTIVGRRGGKSQIAAIIAVALACRSYPDLAPGERGILMLLAKDRKGAKVVYRYIRELFAGLPQLKRLVVRTTRNEIVLNNGVTIEINTSNFRNVRGPTCVGVILDELAYWDSDEAGSNPDQEIIAAIRPSMATVPGAMMVGISSVFSQHGALYENYRTYWGKPGDVLVWYSTSREMNPNISDEYVRRELARDPARADAEYNSIWRGDHQSFVTREVLDHVVVAGRTQLPYVPGVRYRGFLDLARGQTSAGDSCAAAVGHTEVIGKAHLQVVDWHLEIKPPFRPTDALARIASGFTAYDVKLCYGDGVGANFPTDLLEEHGIHLKPAEGNKSTRFLKALGLITTKRCELPDSEVMISQLVSLKRKLLPSGTEEVTSRGHDDVADAICGILATGAAGSDHTEEWFRRMNHPSGATPSRGGGLAAIPRNSAGRFGVSDVPPEHPDVTRMRSREMTVEQYQVRHAKRMRFTGDRIQELTTGIAPLTPPAPLSDAEQAVKDAHEQGGRALDIHREQ